MITNSNLHYTIIRYIIDNGYAPDSNTLSQLLNASVPDIEKGLYALQDYHGVVLHPHASKVWVIHPFSLAPTNFLVKTEKGLWWGNCAWCSLGIAALLKQDLTITTRIAAYDEQVVIQIKDGDVLNKDLYIHFPVPMMQAWDNVIYTCSNMLVFKNEEQVNEWCSRHHIPRGDLQPVNNIWQFSKKWYGNHLDPNWQKWTMAEAKEIFRSYNLTSDTWKMENSDARF
jgi:Alkylmercury lyase